MTLLTMLNVGKVLEVECFKMFEGWCKKWKSLFQNCLAASPKVKITSIL